LSTHLDTMDMNEMDMGDMGDMGEMGGEAATMFWGTCPRRWSRLLALFASFRNCL